MKIDSIALKNSFEYFNIKREFKNNNIMIRDNLISVKLESEITINFKFYKKITKYDTRNYDDLMETLRKMAVELTKIAKAKGKKKITVVFDDVESAVRIASFQNGEYFKKYLSIINMIMLTDEILYKNDKTIKHYTIKPKISDYSIKTKKEYYEPRILSLKITNKLIHRAYYAEFSSPSIKQ